MQKLTAVGVFLLVLLHGVTAARELQQATKQTSTKVTVVFFDDNDLDGDHRTFTATIPSPAANAKPGSTCSPCNELSIVRTNSWESYIFDNGYQIQVFDGHLCSGKTATLPDRSKDNNQIKAGTSGNIPGTLQDSIDSWRACI
ncbi:hypothetical protein WJX72_007061 [[Myrmecia] bisecta]|uniref:Uncharacterized protein n=1 Tax=[Myrmecia] bisecta TaxID=41462 RepID=A0AAW1Q7J2_9CHLO